MGQIDLRSKAMNFESDGAVQFDTSNFNIVSSGDYTVNSNKTIKMSCDIWQFRNYKWFANFRNGKVNIGKQINVLGGRIETNSINPLGGFDVNVGQKDL